MFSSLLVHEETSNDKTQIKQSVATLLENI